MPVVSTLAVNLTARTAAFDKKMKKSKKQVSAFSKVAAKAGATLKRFSAIGAAAAVAAFVLITKSAMKTIDVTAKLSDRIGIATEDIIALRHAAEITGVSGEALDKSLEMFVRRLGEVRQGTGEAKVALKELGIDVNKLVTLSPAAAFSLIADEINKMALQADKAVIAYQLFGRAGTKLLNTLALGSGGLAEMKKEAEELGLTFNRFDAAKIEEANDAIQRMKESFTGIGQDLAIQLAPAIKAIADITTEAIKNAKQRKATLKELGGGGKPIDLKEGLLDNLKTEMDLAKLIAAGFEKQLEELKATTDSAAHGFIQYRQKLELLEFQFKSATERVNEFQKAQDDAAIATVNAETFAAAAAKVKKFNDGLERQIRLLGGTANEKAIDKLKELGSTLTDVAKKDFDLIIEKSGELATKLQEVTVAAAKANELKSIFDGLKDSIKTSAEKMADFKRLLESGLKAGLITIEQFNKLLDEDAVAAIEKRKAAIKSFADSVKQSLKGPIELLKDFRKELGKAVSEGFLTRNQFAEALKNRAAELFPKPDVVSGVGPSISGRSEEIRTAFVNVAGLTGAGINPQVREQERTNTLLLKQNQILAQIEDMGIA